jgi:serine/threonine protein kinase
MGVLLTRSANLVPDTCVSFDEFKTNNKIAKETVLLKKNFDYGIEPFTFVYSVSYKTDGKYQPFAIKRFVAEERSADKEARMYTKLQGEHALSILHYYGCIRDPDTNIIYNLAFEKFGKYYPDVIEEIRGIFNKNRKMLFLLLADMTASVAELHARSIVHNKVGPESFLYKIEYEKIEIKIADFTCAIIGEDNPFTFYELSDAIYKKIYFIRGRKDQETKDLKNRLISRKDHFKTDIYALGRTLLILVDQLSNDRHKSFDFVQFGLKSEDEVKDFMIKHDLDYCLGKTKVCLRHLLGELFFPRSLDKPEDASHDMKTYAAGLAEKLRSIAEDPVLYVEPIKESVSLYEEFEHLMNLF